MYYITTGIKRPNVDGHTTGINSNEYIKNQTNLLIFDLAKLQTVSEI